MKSQSKEVVDLTKESEHEESFDETAESSELSIKSNMDFMKKSFIIMNNTLDFDTKFFKIFSEYRKYSLPKESFKIKHKKDNQINIEKLWNPNIVSEMESNILII
jgi:hypothetical protein